MEDNLISEELINDKKARINELRDSINNIRSLGFQPPHDMTFELAELENSVLINSELIPTLIGVLEQEFSKFTSEINLLLNYSPDSGLNISLCNDRKQKIRSKRLKIKVVYSNGGTIKCQFGGDTIVENIRTGKVDGNRLIIKEEIFRDIDESVRKSCAYKSAGKGYYVHTSLTTSRKVEIIKTIIEKLGIDADVFAE